MNQEEVRFSWNKLCFPGKRCCIGPNLCLDVWKGKMQPKEEAAVTEAVWPWEKVLSLVGYTHEEEEDEE